MYIANSVTTIVPAIPDTLKQYVKVFSVCVLHESDIAPFSAAFNALAAYMVDHPFPQPNHGVKIIFCDENLPIYANDDDAVGGFDVFAYYHMDKLRTKNTVQIFTAALEELCHALYVVHDEVRVKHLVYDVALTILPGISFYDLYSQHIPAPDL